jgi:hypothetical protein
LDSDLILGDLEGNTIELTAYDDVARMILHIVDQMNGIPFTKRAQQSGCVTTAITSCSSINISNTLVEKSGVPINITLVN